MLIQDSSPSLIQKPTVPPPRPPQRSDSLLAEDITPAQSERDEPEPELPSAAETVTPVATEPESAHREYEGELSPQVEAALMEEWARSIGPDFEIIVAQISKFKEGGGLGISLEGTVEKVDGEEQNPHHYIRSVLPNGPVGQNGKLMSGDELLEVNNRKLLGLYHSDVVAILKDLPVHVRIVCARYV